MVRYDRHLMVLLVVCVFLFDALSLLSLEIRMPTSQESLFTISVALDLDGHGRPIVLRTTVTYYGEDNLPVIDQAVRSIYLNVTRQRLFWRNFHSRPADGSKFSDASEMVFTRGRAFEFVQEIQPSTDLQPASVLEVGLVPDPRTGLAGINATYRFPSVLEPGTTLDLEPYRLPERTLLAQDNFSTNFQERARPSILRRIEATAIPVLLTLLLFLSVLVVRRESAWFRDLGSDWWVLMVLILVLALGLRLVYGARFHDTLLLNNPRNVRWAELLAAGEPITWAVGSGHSYVLALVYATVGTERAAWGTEGIAMAVSLTVSLLHVLVLGMLGAALLGPRTGLVASFFLATLPLDLLYGMAVRRDGLAMVFLTLSLLFAVRGGRLRSRTHLYAASAALGMTLFTIRAMLVLTPLWLAFLHLSCDLRPREQRGPLAFLFLASVIPALLLILDAMLLLGEIPILGGMTLTTDYVVANTAWMVYYLFGGDHHASLLTLLAIVGVLSLRRRSPGKMISLIAFPLVMAVFLAVHRVPIAYCTSHRHLIFIYPSLLLLAGEGFVEVRGRWRERYGSEPWLILAFAALYVLVVHASYLDGVLALRRCA
jgi:hypothetical protein